MSLHPDRDVAALPSSSTMAAPTPAGGPTLLPASVASTVSLLSRSTTASVRLSSRVTSAVLATAKTGTLASLALSRSAVDVILAPRSSSDPYSRPAGWASRGIGLVHSSLELTELLVATAFELGQTTVDAVAALAENYVLTLDSLFGSTESSRAVAAIVALVREEYKDASEHDGEVKKRDVLAGITCFAVLQWRTRARVDAADEVELVWDVVVEVGGADEDETVVPEMDDDETVVGEQEQKHDQNGGMLGSADEGLPAVLLSKLPPNAEIAMTTESTTTRTTTIEVVGTSPPDFTPPSGAVVLSEGSHHDGRQRYQIVYQTVTSTAKRKHIRREDGHDIISENESDVDVDGHNDTRRVFEMEDPPVAKSRATLPALQLPPGAKAMDSDSDNDDEGRLVVMGDAPPPVPPRPTAIPPAREDMVSEAERAERRTSSGRRREHGGESSLPRPVHANQGKRLTNPSPNRSSSSRHGLEKRPPKAKDEREPKKSSSSFRKAFTRDKKKYSPETSSHTSSHSSHTSEIPRRAPKSAHAVLGPSPLPPSDGRLKKHARRSTPPPTPELRLPTRPSSRTELYSRRVDSLTASPELSPRQHHHHHHRREPSRRELPRRTSSSLSIYSIHDDSSPAPPPQSHHHLGHHYGHGHSRALSHAPSIYTLSTTHSAASLLLSYAPPPTHADPGPYYPAHTHLLQNLRKYVRFSAASYGANFMRLLGIGSPPPAPRAAAGNRHVPAHHAFSHYASLPVDTILLSSYADPDGGFDAAGQTGTGRPLVHFVCVDHDAAAVVVTCRGTLGLEDVLTDLTCEYADLVLPTPDCIAGTAGAGGGGGQPRTYRVHKGILASASLLLQSRLLATLKAALETYPTYGLVLTGHSLGGGVAALTALLIASPSPSSSSSDSTTGGATWVTAHAALPPGRRVHAYAYGPPACVCERLRRRSRTLVTTVVNGRDIVPSLSIGQIRDFHSVALAFHEDTAGVMRDVRKRFFAGLLGGGGWGIGVIGGMGAGGKGGAGGMAVGGIPEEEEDEERAWELAVLKTLRAGMAAEKLVPPGEVWCVSREPFVGGGEGVGEGGGRVVVATGGSEGAGGVGGEGVGDRQKVRCRAWVVQDVPRRFGEVRFAAGMFGDHNPGEYEKTLDGLRRGICDE